jgi:hypothetical protein
MLHARPLVAGGGDAQRDLLNLAEGVMTHFQRADRWIEAKGVPGVRYPATPSGRRPPTGATGTGCYAAHPVK